MATYWVTKWALTRGVIVIDNPRFFVGGEVTTDPGPALLFSETKPTLMYPTRRGNTYLPASDWAPDQEGARHRVNQMIDTELRKVEARKKALLHMAHDGVNIVPFKSPKSPKQADIEDP